MTPIKVPIVMEINDPTKAINKVNLKPYINLESISLPSSSVPSKKPTLNFSKPKGGLNRANKLVEFGS